MPGGKNQALLQLHAPSFFSPCPRAVLPIAPACRQLHLRSSNLALLSEHFLRLEMVALTSVLTSVLYIRDSEYADARMSVFTGK